MKKNVFQGFSENKIENLGVIHGGFRYSPTTAGGASSPNDEELVTEPGDIWLGGCSVNECSDFTWEDCEPGTNTAPGIPRANAGITP